MKVGDKVKVITGTRAGDTGLITKVLRLPFSSVEHLTPGVDIKEPDTEISVYEVEFEDDTNATYPESELSPIAMKIQQKVRVIKGKHKGRIAIITAICDIPPSNFDKNFKSSRIEGEPNTGTIWYTVRFIDDGTEISLPIEYLEIFNE